MKTCDRFEPSVSAIVDGEIDPRDLPAVVDHLAECGSCRSFYRQARALDALVLEAASSPSAAPAPNELWERIQDRADARNDARERRLRVWRAVAGAAAAVVLLAAGAWLGTRLAGPSAPGHFPGASFPTVAALDLDDDYVEVVLERDRGRMTDARFVQITAELLQADGRYRRKMAEVMNALEEVSTGREGSGEPGHVPGRWAEVQRAVDESEIEVPETARPDRL